MFWEERYESWSDSIGMNLPVVWAPGAGISDLQEFVRGTRLPQVSVVSFVERGSWVAGRLRVLGTPMVYLVDKRGLLRFAEPGSFLPPADSTRAACGF